MGRDLRNAQLMSRLRGVAHRLMPVGVKIGKRSGEFAEISRDGLRAQCLRAWPQDAGFTAQWEALSRGAANPFNSPIWHNAVARHLISDGSLRHVAVWRGETLKAVFPLAYRANATLETPGRWLSDYLDPPMDVAEEAACWSIFLELICGLWDWSVSGLVLPNIRPDLSCRKLLPELGNKFGLTYSETEVTTIARIQLPDTFEKYMALHNSAERKNTLRKVRKAVTQANAKLVEISDIAAGVAALNLVFDQIESGKKREKAGFMHKVVEPMLMGAAPALIESGWLRMLQLQIQDGKPAATMIAFSTAEGPKIYNVSYDEACKEWSPGSVAFAMAIEKAIERKCRVFDLLRGGDEYKKRMHATMEPLYRVTLKRG